MDPDEVIRQAAKIHDELFWSDGAHEWFVQRNLWPPDRRYLVALNDADFIYQVRSSSVIFARYGSVVRVGWQREERLKVVTEFPVADVVTLILGAL